MKIKELLDITAKSNRIKILENEAIIWIGWACEIPEKLEEKNIQRFSVEPEIRCRNWKERRLMAPLQPKELAEYKFTDMEMKLYYKIAI